MVAAHSIFRRFKFGQLGGKPEAMVRAHVGILPPPTSIRADRRIGLKSKTQMRLLRLEYWNGEAAARPAGGTRSVGGVPPTGAEVHR